MFLDVDELLYYLIDSSRQRIMVIDNLDVTTTQKIKNMRPIPNNYVLIGNNTGISSLLIKVSLFV